ncbi:MAG: glycosyltransferase family 9 protein [Candidatus Omnitrophica bacterium]|nr:glycosyltransferase family 9 protein [Candidatus Omnitrophota bacterium]
MLKRQWIKLFTNGLCFLLKILSPIFKKKVELSLKNKEFSNILVIKLWAIGEVVIATPVLRSLRKRYPGAIISVLVGEVSEPIIRNNPNINRVIPIDEKIFLKFKLLKIIGLLSRLNKEKFDCVIILHQSLYISLFAFLLNIPVRLGFDRGGQGVLNTHNIALDGKNPIFLRDYNVKIVEEFGIYADDWHAEIYTGKNEDEFARRFLLENGILSEDIIVGLIIAGGVNLAATSLQSNIISKLWPIENYIELSNKLLNNGMVKIFFFGGEHEMEKYGNKIPIVRGRAFNLLGKLSILEMLAIIKRCNYVVANDCGPMHIASSLNVPMLVIFGPTDPGLFRHFQSNVEIIKSNVECSPCFNPYTFPNIVVDCKHVRCMKDVNPDQVYGMISKKVKFI